VSDPYLYPNSDVLRNKLGLRDAAALEQVERALVTQRMAEGVPEGRFDLDHLRAIHRHLFQDLFDWAGEIRRVEIAKGGDQFQFARFIETEMSDVHRRLTEAQFLQSCSPGDFAREAGRIVGDINYIHPFREGNGRVQLQYLRLLADRAGHPIDLTRIEASKAAFRADYSPMAAEIFQMLSPFA
jgi:cell filamentation protein